MKGNRFMHLQDIGGLVQKYQSRWEFCLVRKAHSYYWPGESAPGN
jgi:hypothetical protein